MDTSSAWQTVLGELEVSLSKANFTTWFKNTRLLSHKDGEVIIGVPNIFTKEWLENKYNKQISDALHKALPEVKTITYRVGNTIPKEEVIEEVEIIEKEEERLEKENDELFISRYSFDSFVVGDTTKLAFAAAQSVAKNPGATYNPLFIYGGVGLGKTHLMQAIANEILKKDPKKKIEYVSSEKFTTDFIASLNKQSNGFKDKYRGVDVLLIDDMQFLAGKEQTQ
ncbi:AAA family ATPase, partial [Patescibacteria group bacterium]|nr:AAA family ATPase [Patescibacteria group bacterium]